jgi:hypothetical protein
MEFLHVYVEFWSKIWYILSVFIIVKCAVFMIRTSQCCRIWLRVVWLISTLKDLLLTFSRIFYSEEGTTVSSEKYITLYQTTWRHVPEGCYFDVHRCKNLKSYIVVTFKKASLCNILPTWQWRQQSLRNVSTHLLNYTKSHPSLRKLNLFLWAYVLENISSRWQHHLCIYKRGLVSLWLYKENNELRDWENVFTLHIPPWAPNTYDFFVLTSLTHPREILLVVLQTWK